MSDICPHRAQLNTKRAREPLITSLRNHPVTSILIIVGLPFIGALPVATDIGLAPFSNSLLAAETESYFDLRWYEQGPYRGGRTTAYAGVSGAPHTFYIGATGGGLWRTTNAGGDWKQLGIDEFRSGSVGAIAVSPSQPTTLYVGFGESPYRLYTSTFGDGVYRSDDGGDSWRHLGLDDSSQVASIAVDPKDPNTLWVAVQGSPWAPTLARGVYKSSDGGQSWRHVLYVSDTTGAVDIALDPGNAERLYVTLWDHEYRPWYLGSGGPGSGVMRSDDGGENWRRIENGLPSGKMGKVGVAPANNSTGRVWLLIESDSGLAGLYRSDNYGDDWRLVNGEGKIRTRPWYYTHLFVDPNDADTLYSFGQDAHISTDAGVSFEEWPILGYDYHGMWINPQQPDVWLITSDAGASVTLDGGSSWSTLYNQPTAQLYRVAVDQQIPYRIYTAQQDNTTVGMSSRPDWGGTDSVYFSAVGGGETGYVEPDPFDPNIVYATSELGSLTRHDRRTGQTNVIHTALNFAEGVEPRQLDYRYVVNSPVLPSTHERCLLYHGAQLLLRSRDCGGSWAEASPDLTYDDEKRQGKGGGPYTNEIINHFGAIAAISESPLDKNVIWTAGNDGAVSLTRDGGDHWRTFPAGILPEGSANSIEASPHRTATAYVAIFSLPWNDNRPHLFRSDDFGANWKRITDGLPNATPVRVVREDPTMPGLLFAGTENAVFYSDNGGKDWLSLRLNMPAVAITDLKFAGNDVVISTQGRGIWVLHDITPLRQLEPTADVATAYVLKPEPAWQVATNDQSQPYDYVDALPTGAVIDFVIPDDTDSAATGTLEISDAAGDLVRRIEFW